MPQPAFCFPATRSRSSATARGPLPGLGSWSATPFLVMGAGRAIIGAMLTGPLGLLALVCVWLVGHAVVVRLDGRGVPVRGVEYVAAGLLASLLSVGADGPTLAGALAPLLAVILVVVGLEVGLRFRLRALAELRADAFQGAALLAGVTLLLVGGATIATLVWLGRHDALEIGAVTLALGSAAIPSASRTLASLIRRTRASGWMSEMLVAVSWLCEVIAVLLYGLLFCVMHAGTVKLGRPLTGVEWAVLSLVLGAGLGAVTAALMGNDRDPDRLLVVLVGMGLLLAGSAWFLNLSPLFLGTVAGMAIANLSPGRERLLDLTGLLARPLVPVLGFFAAALWALPTAAEWVLVAAFLVSRLPARWLGGVLVEAASTHPAADTRGMGRGFVSQGALSVGMALGFHQAFPHIHGAAVLTAVLLGAALSAVREERLARDLLVDAGDIPLELAPGTEAPA